MTFSYSETTWGGLSPITHHSTMKLWVSNQPKQACFWTRYVLEFLQLYHVDNIYSARWWNINIFNFKYWFCWWSYTSRGLTARRSSVHIPWSLRAHLVSVWVFSRSSALLPQSKNMFFRLIRDYQLPLGLRVNSVCSALDWKPVRCAFGGDLHRQNPVTPLMGWDDGWMDFS